MQESWHEELKCWPESKKERKNSHNPRDIGPEGLSKLKHWPVMLSHSDKPIFPWDVYD